MDNTFEHQTYLHEILKFKPQDPPMVLSEYKFIPPYESPLKEETSQGDEIYHFKFPALSDELPEQNEEDLSVNTLSKNNSERVKSKGDIENPLDPNNYCLCDVFSIQTSSNKTAPICLSQLKISPLGDGKRWGLKEDKILFHTIQTLCDLNMLSFSELQTLDLNSAKRHKSIRRLHKVLGWKSSFKELARRIKNKISDTFSKREIKHLKKILNYTYQYTNVDYHAVLYEFPGKTLERVKHACDAICEARFTKKLMEVDVNENHA